jgi:hydrocephalus-inducing protein
MNFNLRVASDTEEINENSIKKDNQNTDYGFKEFSLIPSNGFIPPQSEIKLLIEFVPHFIKKYETNLIVDIDDVGNDLFSLPISARSIVPTINLVTNKIDMGRCFIYHSYEKLIKLSNDTPLKARYYLIPSKSRDPFNFTSIQSEVISKNISIRIK